MIKEISLGMVIAWVIFSLVSGYNIVPFLAFGLLVAGLFFVINGKGLNSGFALKEKRKKLNQKILFENIGGQDVAIKEFREALDFIKSYDQIKHLGIRPIKGILLTGPPGTGKTMLAKAAANYTDAVFSTASGSEFVEMYAGVGAQRVRKLFNSVHEKAKKEGKKNAVIFIDEVEIIGGKRGQNTSHMEYDQTLNELLVQMDGIKENENIKILIVAATNRIDILDPALLRPGRFDRQVKVDLPDKDGRYKVLKIHVQNKPLDPNVDLQSIAKETLGFSGAHLESLTNEAAILAMREKKDKIENSHFQEAIDKVMLGEKLSQTPSKTDLFRVAVHETGHALISENLKPGSVSLLTITPRGGALGYMRQNEDEDHYLYTKEQLDNQIAVLLSGAVAEEIILGNRSTGASNDYEKAIQTAENIIITGLSSLGIVDIKNISQEKKQNEISQIIMKQEEIVKKLLAGKKVLIEKIVNQLFNQEKISGDIFRSIIAGCLE